MPVMLFHADAAAAATAANAAHSISHHQQHCNLYRNAGDIWGHCSIFQTE